MQAKQASISHSVLLDVAAEAIDCNGALGYRLDENKVTLTEGQAKAADLCTQIDSDGRADWGKLLPGNNRSYAAAFAENR